jgi:hypothetical protein
MLNSICFYYHSFRLVENEINVKVDLLQCVFTIKLSTINE